MRCGRVPHAGRPCGYVLYMAAYGCVAALYGRACVRALKRLATYGDTYHALPRLQCGNFLHTQRSV